MKIRDLSSYSSEEIESLIQRIPFYKELLGREGDQLEKLMGFSCLVEFAPGETVMRRGDKGSWLYFLIKGRLDIFSGQTEPKEPLDHITPGHLFGDLAILCHHERKVSVAAEQGEKAALLFATDLKHFGQLNDFSSISLATKISFYKTMVHNTLGRLQDNEITAEDHPLMSELRRVMGSNSALGNEAELELLHQQAKTLASILDHWNEPGVLVHDVAVTVNEKTIE